MKNIIDIKHLSREEKIIVMEAIWVDLLDEEESIESPDWHREALKKTEIRLDAGQEKSMDWREAKKELRKQFE